MAQRPHTSPPTGRYFDQPVMPDWRSTDSVESMHEIMWEHERGMFARSALLVEEMMTDDRISGVLATRIGGLLCAELTFKPADDRRKSLKLARILGGSDESDSDGEWLRMLDFDTAFDLLKWKIMLGVAVAEIVWETAADMWRPRLVVWHPRFLWWDWSTREYRLTTGGADPNEPVQIGQDGWVIRLPRTDRGNNRQGKWFVWGRQYSWLQGAVRPLGMKYLDRVWNERDWARYCEKHGIAIVEGKVPSGTDTEEKRRFQDDVDHIGSETTIISPQSPAGQPSYGIQLHEATARSWETFKARKETLDTDIAVCLLGQNLTSEVKGGSFAAASVHEGIRIDKKRQDRELYRQIREQVLIPWVEYNYEAGRGDRLAPYPQAHIDPPEDEESEANALKLLGEACRALSDAYPAVDIRAMLEAAGVPIDEEIAAVLDATRKLPPEPAAQGGAPAGQPGGEEKSEKQLTTAALTAVAMLKASKARGSVSLKRVAKYHDAVVARARKEAAGLLAPELEALREDIDAAQTLPDLKRRIVKRFKATKPPRELAALLERVTVLGHMTGRADIAQAF